MERAGVKGITEKSAGTRILATSGDQQSIKGISEHLRTPQLHSWILGHLSISDLGSGHLSI
jgi:hypothetical protein